MRGVQGNSIKVDLKVLLPDRAVVTVTQAKNALARQVYQAVVEKVAIPPDTAKCFALFEIVEYSFGETLKCSGKGIIVVFFWLIIKYATHVNIIQVIEGE